MSINKQEFTTAGRDLLGRANNGESLRIPRVVIGAGRTTDKEDLWPLTELIDYKMDAVITQKTDLGNGILLIDAAFNSSQAPEAFELCEVGVMAAIDAEAVRLYSVANVLATGADHVDPNVESIHAFKIKVNIDRAENVTVIIGDSTDILAENIGAETVGPGWFKEKVANTLRFKRAVEGTGIELDEDDDTITIETKTLKVNTDLYVPVGHPDNVAGDPSFPTIQAALAYLQNFNIPSGILARIHVGRGTFNNNQTVVVNHPNGAQIQILGTLGTQRNFSSVTQSGSDFTLFGAAGVFNGMTAGDWFRLRGGGTQAGQGISGLWQVTAVAPDGSNLTFTPGFGPMNLAGANGWIKPLPSVISLPINTNGFQIQTPLNRLDSFIILGNPNSTTTITGCVCSNGNVNIFDCGSRLFRESGGSSSGFSASGLGRIQANNCSGHLCTNGFIVGGGGQGALTGCDSNSCSERAVWIESATANLNTHFSFHSHTGVYVNNGSYCSFDNIYLNNNQYGFFVNAHSYVASSSPAVSCQCINNVVEDIRLTMMSGFLCSNAPAQFNTTNVPPGNNVGPWPMTADGCVFKPRANVATQQPYPLIEIMDILVGQFIEWNDGRICTVTRNDQIKQNIYVQFQDGATAVCRYEDFSETRLIETA
jgi:hypothetical protein